MRAVVVVEFDLGEDDTFQSVMDTLRRAFETSDHVNPVSLHGAIRESATRVMAAITAEPTNPDPQPTTEDA